MREERSISGRHVGRRKAIFLVDALISATFALLLLSAALEVYKVYSVAFYDEEVSRSVDLLLLTSTKAVMSSNGLVVGNGGTCVLRIYHGVRRVCGEVV